MQPINYDSLVRLRKTTSPPKRGFKSGLIIALFIFLLLPAMLLILVIIGQLGTTISLVIFGIAFPAVCYLGYRQYRQRQAAFRKFTADNGWQYINKEVNLPSRQSLAGKIKSTNTVVVGSFGDVNFWLNEIVLDLGGHQGPSDPLLEVLLQAKQSIPEFVLVPKSLARLLPLFFDGQIDKLKRISLEGDFDKHYQLSIPPGTQVEALSFITPEVMMQVKDLADGAVVYASGGVCSIMTNQVELFYETIQPLFNFSQKFAKELAEKYN